MYEKVRYAPIHGHTPVNNLSLEAKPSMAGMILGIAGSAASNFKVGSGGGLEFRN